MQLYEVSNLGDRTPLSDGEIAKLFRAGRLHRDTRCKAVDAKNWRTVDELFPLLKYDRFGDAGYAANEETDVTVTSRHLFVAVAATVLLALTAFTVFLLYQRSVPQPSHHHTPAAIAPSARPAPGVNTAPLITSTPVPRMTVPHVQPRDQNPPRVVQVPSAPASNPEIDRRLIEEQRRRAQEQHYQAVAAERLREKNAREAAEKQRDAGTDTILPLDEYGSVYVGGAWVSVKVHDNDVTSFDAWVNGAFYDDLRKNKGISGSRSDETPIYSNGRATLYYVWELAGNLNHCRLRVRER